MARGDYFDEILLSIYRRSLGKACLSSIRPRISLIIQLGIIAWAPQNLFAASNYYRVYLFVRKNLSQLGEEIFAHLDTQDRFVVFSLSLCALCSLKIVQSLGKRESCRKSRVSVLFHVFSPDFDSDKRFRKSVRRYSNVRYRRTIIGRIVRFFHAQFSPFFFFLFSTTIFSNRGCCSTT